MGIPIIYCDKCQEMIPAQDIEQKKMVFMGGKNYCHKCSIAILGKAPSQIVKNINTPVNKPAGAPVRQPSGIRQVASSRGGYISSARKTPEGTGRIVRRPQKNNTYLIGAVVAIIVLLIILIVVMMGNNTGKTRKTTVKNHPVKTEPGPTQEEILAKAKKAFDDVVEYETKNPLESKEIIEQIEKNIPLTAKTEYESKLEEKKAEHREKKRFLEDVNDYITSFNKNPSDYDHYLENYGKLKDKAKDIKNNDAVINFIDDQIKKVNDAFDKEAMAEFENLKKEVEELKQENYFDRALSRCDAFQESLKKNKSVENDFEKLVDEIKEAKEEYLKRKRDEWKIVFGPNNQDLKDWMRIATSAGGKPLDVNIKNDIIIVENNNLAGTQTQANEDFFVFGDSSWSKYTVEFEYKVEQGAANVVTRVNYQFSPDGKSGQILGKAFRIPLQRSFSDKWLKVLVTVTEDSLIIKEDGKEELKGAIPNEVSETGKAGFILRPGDKIAIKSVRIKGVE